MPLRVTRARQCKQPIRVVVDLGPKAKLALAHEKTKCPPTKSATPLKAERLECSSRTPDAETEDEDTIICPNQPDEITEPAVPAFSNDVVTPEVQVVKRKRGRPRKNPADVTTKKLKFQTPTDGTSVGPNGSVFPVTPYPGKTRDMVRVPRPPNAFMIYGKENRRRLSVEHPGSTNKNISKLLGEKWQSLDEETKTKYKESARKALQEHKNKYPNYQYIPTEARMRKKSKAAAKAILDQKRSNREEQKVTVVPPSDLTEANKENIPPPLLPPAPQEPEASRIITELFVAPPGYEDVEIEGLDKFVLWENKLIPYREWVGAEGDVKRLSGNYTQVPEQLLQPITNCVIAGTQLEAVAEPGRLYSGNEGQRDSGEVVNTMVWNESDERMTLNECNACPSSEADKNMIEAEKTGSEMDAHRLLQDLMTGDVRSGAGAVVVEQQPQSSTPVLARRLFWNEASMTSEDEE